MSWDISLDGDTAVERHMDGGTYLLGGTTTAELNVTYNYGRHFRFGELDGRIAGETIPLLAEAVDHLGVTRDADYWAPTEGNAGYACSVLLAWAEQYPALCWDVH